MGSVFPDDEFYRLRNLDRVQRAQRGEKPPKEGAVIIPLFTFGRLGTMTLSPWVYDNDLHKLVIPKPP